MSGAQLWNTLPDRTTNDEFRLYTAMRALIAGGCRVSEGVVPAVDETLGMLIDPYSGELTATGVEGEKFSFEAYGKTHYCERSSGDYYRLVAVSH